MKNVHGSFGDTLYSAKKENKTLLFFFFRWGSYGCTVPSAIQHHVVDVQSEWITVIMHLSLSISLAINPIIAFSVSSSID